MRRLSSDWTFLYKFVIPTFCIGEFALLTLLMFTAPGSLKGRGDVRQVRWIFLTVTIVSGPFFYWWCMRLKKVAFDQDVLLISNFRKEVGIPLHELEQVSGTITIFVIPELIWLHFRRPTSFGKRIVFMPKLRFSFRFTRHPLVKELEEFIEQSHTGTQVAH